MGVYILWGIVVIVALIIGLNYLGAAITGFFGGVGLAIMTALAGVFVFGAFWFWVLVGIMSCFIIYSIDEVIGDKDEYEGGRLAVFVLIALALILQFFGDIHVFSYIGTHPIYATLWVIAYLGVGIGYAFLRWTWFLLIRKLKFKKAKNRFFERENITENTVPSHLAEQWKYEVLPYSQQPRARAHKYRIIHWMAYWPWSAIWFFVSDFIHKIFKNLYELFHTSFQKISDWMWRGVNAELQNIRVEPEDPASPGPDVRRRK